MVVLMFLSMAFYGFLWFTHDFFTAQEFSRVWQMSGESFSMSAVDGRLEMVPSRHGFQWLMGQLGELIGWLMVDSLAHPIDYNEFLSIQC